MLPETTFNSFYKLIRCQAYSIPFISSIKCVAGSLVVATDRSIQITEYSK